MAHARINQWGKNSVCNLQYRPRTWLVLSLENLFLKATKKHQDLVIVGLQVLSFN